ncbi:hypothetical protein P0D88_48020 [Paraburkholderia sp. RL18-103-BIB-C]|uniref:hypothetical protein n=1 Tax=Paraburkholderia sp. RL18-103-BIB-C TaxID=3031637 RepID=UPI0038B6FDAF
MSHGSTRDRARRSGTPRPGQRNVELMWLTGRLTPDFFKTIADFRRDNGPAIRNVFLSRLFTALNLLPSMATVSSASSSSPTAQFDETPAYALAS